jgi:peptide/nickel transport system permease protein
VGKYLVRRLLIAIPILLGVSIINFSILHLAPGDPILAMMGEDAGAGQGAIDTMTPERLENLRKQWGLDQPLYVQYLKWLNRVVLHGDLGRSHVTPEPVTQRIVSHLPNTILLTLTSLALAILVGTAVGVMSALRQYSILDYLATIITMVGVSVPGFIIAIFAMYVLGVRLKWLPVFGVRDLTGGPEPTNVLGVVWDRIYHLILPASTLAFESAATFMRYARSSILETLGADFVRTARSKGLSERMVLLRHVFRNAALPLVTIIGLRLPSLFSGSVLIEAVFAWPGIGTLSVTAIGERDYPLVLGILLVFSVLVVFANLMTDVAYAYVDPRIRYE